MDMDDNGMEKLDGLWGDLAKEAEECALVADLPYGKSHALRHFTPQEKLGMSYLKGFVPAWLLLMLGAFLGLLYLNNSQAAGEAIGKLVETNAFIANDHHRLRQLMDPLLWELGGAWRVVPLLAAVLSVPLAWLLAPLWNILRARPVLYFLLPLVTVLVGQLAITPLISVYVFATKNVPVTFFGFIHVLQLLYQGYLNWWGPLLAILLGCTLFLCSYRARGKMPWLEVNRPKLARSFAASLVLGFPVLILVLCSFQGGPLLSRIHAWQASFPQAQAFSVKDEELWGELRGRLYDLKPYDKEAVLNIKAADIAPLEKTAHELLESHPRGGRNKVASLALFLRYAGLLNDPTPLCLELLESMPRLAGSYDGGWDFLVVFNNSSLHFATSSLSKAELEGSAFRIKAMRESLPTLQQGFDAVVDRLLSSLIMEKALPLRAFGYELPFSLESFVLDFKKQRILKPYLDCRAELDYKESGKLYAQLKSNGVARSFARDALSAWANNMRWERDKDELEEEYNAALASTAELDKKDILDCLELILSLRLYKEQHGHYPAKLAELSTSLSRDFPLESFSYRVQGHTVQLQDLRAVNNKLYLSLSFSRNGYRQAVWNLR